MSQSTITRRCVLLFSRSPRAEARAKNLRRGASLFAYTRRRVEEAVSALSEVDLLVFEPLPGARGRSLPQRGRTFGERLANAFEDARSLGYAQIVAVPGDVPELSTAALRAAFAALAASEVVLGPSPDGGVWLIGTCGAPAALLTGVPWLTRHVLGALRENAPDAAVLESLPDVDCGSDARRLRRSTQDSILRALLDSLAEPDARPGAPTRRVVIRAGDSRAARAPPPLASFSSY